MLEGSGTNAPIPCVSASYSGSAVNSTLRPGRFVLATSAKLIPCGMPASKRTPANQQLNTPCLFQRIQGGERVTERRDIVTRLPECRHNPIKKLNFVVNHKNKGAH